MYKENIMHRFVCFISLFALSNTLAHSSNSDPFIKKKLNASIEREREKVNPTPTRFNKRVDITSMAVDAVGIWKREPDIPQTSNEGIEILPGTNP